MTSPVVAVMAQLAADPDVVALTGERIYGNELPQAIDGDMPTHAIVVEHAGGGVMPIAYQEHTDLRFDVFAYGATRHEANRLWYCVHRCLKPMTTVVREGVRLYWARPAGGPMTLNDPDTTWPYSLSTWQVLLQEVPA